MRYVHDAVMDVYQDGGRNDRGQVVPNSLSRGAQARRGGGTNDPRTSRRGTDTSPPEHRLSNRVNILLMHTSRYAFAPQSRLAQDVGFSRSTISRLVRGRTQPTDALVQAVTAALGKALKRRLDPREIFSAEGGTYPTRSGCALCGCSGCFPDEAFDGCGNLKPAFRNLRPSEWSLAPEREQPLGPMPGT